MSFESDIAPAPFAVHSYHPVYVSHESLTPAEDKQAFDEGMFGPRQTDQEYEQYLTPNEQYVYRQGIARPLQGKRKTIEHNARLSMCLLPPHTTVLSFTLRRWVAAVRIARRRYSGGRAYLSADLLPWRLDGRE